jgi:L-threonylcarbamoyladenylate synthase
MTHIYTSFLDIEPLAPGAIFACPTDTVYGLSCLAADGDAVKKIREIKGRGKEQPIIVLISNLSQLAQFGISYLPKHEHFLNRIWPGPMSVEFNFTNQEFMHISGMGYFAVRMPQRPDLAAFLEKFGPIVSTSANKTGEPPAITAGEVLDIFPTELDFVIDGGECNNPPSTLIKILR